MSVSERNPYDPPTTDLQLPAAEAKRGIRGSNLCPICNTKFNRWRVFLNSGALRCSSCRSKLSLVGWARTALTILAISYWVFALFVMKSYEGHPQIDRAYTDAVSVLAGPVFIVCAYFSVKFGVPLARPDLRR